MGSGVPEKCARKLELLGAEGKKWGLEAEKVRSWWGRDTGELPSLQGQLRLLRRRAGKERIPRVSCPSQLQLLPSPPQKAWRGSQRWGQRPAATRPHPTRGPVQLEAAGRAG